MQNHNPGWCKTHAYFCKYNQYSHFNQNMITAHFKIRFHWFGANPTSFSFPLPYLQSVKHPQTLPHNRHNLSIEQFTIYPNQLSHIKTEAVQSSGSPPKITHYMVKTQKMAITWIRGTTDSLWTSTCSTSQCNCGHTATVNPSTAFL